MEIIAKEAGPKGAPLVVLVHGSPDRGTAFRRVLRRLEDLHTLVYDRRGYGASAALSPATSLADHAHDLVDILGERRAIVVGHSFGGNVAMHAATLRPDLVTALGVWEPSMCWLPGWLPEHVEEVRGMAQVDDQQEQGERIARALLGAGGWERLDDEGRALRRAEGLAYSLDMGFLLTPPFDVSKVAAPVLVGAGADTTGPHAVGIRLLGEALRVTPRILPETGHLAHIQAPDVFAAFVRDAAALAEGAPDSD